MIVNEKDLAFSGRILDNVHGFIEYTEAEGQIVEMLLFKRMQSIKQLSIVNWIFPGSEHTRYVHSLGVMHICDRIAKHLELSNGQRRIVRFAGLLHDIGHYPLSHVGEFPYKKNPEKIDKDHFCKSINLSVKNKIDTFSIKFESDFMASASKGHYEYIGAEIIKNNLDIRKIIEDECEDENVIEKICDMITGNVDRNNVRMLFLFKFYIQNWMPMESTIC